MTTIARHYIEAPSEHIPLVSSCRFCPPAFSGYGRSPIENTVLLETDEFVVVPSLGSLVEGWLLIVSKEHYLCMAEAPPSLIDELLALRELVRGVIVDKYRTATVFEHGPARAGMPMGCGIDHAHLHVAPLGFDLYTALAETKDLYGLPWEMPKDGLWSLEPIHRRGESYLFVESPSQPPRYCTPSILPCQFVRTVIGAKLGMRQEYDYARFPFYENIAATLNTLEACFRVAHV